MASCEKCWSDAYMLSRGTGKSQSECYMELIKEREDNPCTPEEQAGKDAFECPKCNRLTAHQYIHICMNCGHKILTNER